MSLPLALSFMENLVVALFILVCVALILIVLLQKGRGGGIGAAFGGGGAQSLLGTKTGDFLTWVTICLVALFLILAVLMGKFMRPTGVETLAPGVPGWQQPAQTPAGTEQAPAPAEQESAAPAEGEAAAGTETAPEQAPVEEPAQEPAQP